MPQKQKHNGQGISSSGNFQELSAEICSIPSPIVQQTHSHIVGLSDKYVTFMAPSIKNFATPMLMFDAHVAQKCVLERGHTKLCHVVSYHCEMES